jgi:hypothetical protein
MQNLLDLCCALCKQRYLYLHGSKISHQIKTFIMIIVHDIFICKPGNASKLAKLFKEVMTNEETVHIMTDLSGSYNKVVMVSKYDNLAAFEQSFEKYSQNTEEMKEMMEKMKGYTDLYLTGSREIYRIW